MGKEKEKDIKNKIILVTISALLLALSAPADAQQPKKVARIGYLSTTDPATDSARAEGIRLALRERGYIEGQNIAMEYRFANAPSLHEVKELLPTDARALKLTIQPWQIRAVDDFDRVFAALNKQRPDGLCAARAG